MFDWYKIFNLQEFLDLGLVSRTYTYFFEGLGERSVLVTKGNTVGLTFDGEFLPIEFIDLYDSGKYVSGSYAIEKHSNGDIYLGIEVEE